MSKTLTPNSRPGKQDTRQALIDAGTDIILEKGFNNTGIEQVLKVVGVPKGSFYHYFKSKDDFGLSIIEHHAELLQRKLDQTLTNPAHTPLQRLRHYFQGARDSLKDCACRKGCLFGNLGQEMADQHEVFRDRIETIFTDWRNRFSACIREAQGQGEIPKRLDADMLAEFCLLAWEGAIMRAKVTKNAQPLDTFIHFIFNELFQDGEPGHPA